MTDTVEVLRAHRFCLDPTDAQRRILAQYAGAARWAFNACLGVLVDGHRRYLQEVAWTTYRRLRLPGIGEIRLHDSGKRLGRAIARGDALV